VNDLFKIQLAADALVIRQSDRQGIWIVMGPPKDPAPFEDIHQGDEVAVGSVHIWSFGEYAVTKASCLIAVRRAPL